MWPVALLAVMLGGSLGFVFGVFFASAVLHNRYLDGSDEE